MRDGGALMLDLRESMCFGYFFFGMLPHEAGTERLVRRLLTPGDTFVDVGANVGYYASMAAKLVGATGVVLAVEPMPAALQVLRLNTAQFGNVIISPVAVAESCGKATFFVRKQGDTSSLYNDATAEPIVVDVLTLDTIARGQKQVDLVKIDVEGFELQVLRGAARTIEEHRPVVVFEFLPRYALAQGIDLGDIERFFSAFRYQLRWIDQAECGSAILSAEPSTDLVAIPEEKAASINEAVFL